MFPDLIKSVLPISIQFVKRQECKLSEKIDIWSLKKILTRLINLLSENQLKNIITINDYLYHSKFYIIIFLLNFKNNQYIDIFGHLLL